MAIKVGIFLGGMSREREISFAGGRTVYDNLDKSLFEPVPIFVDSLGNFILLEWEYLYKGSIRDFYPASELLPPSPFSMYIESLATLSNSDLERLIARVGRRIVPDQFSELIDVAFLALHGPYGEDGAIQGLLEWYRIPYTGTGILGGALGINKLVQKRLMQQAGFATPAYQTITKECWKSTEHKSSLFEDAVAQLGLPIVVKSPSQGSSLGVTIVKHHDLDDFIKAVNNSFFIEELDISFWKSLDLDGKLSWISTLVDLREGIGLPVIVHEKCIANPDELLAYIESYFAAHEEVLRLESVHSEQEVLLEQYITGREFSCIVLESEPGNLVALPPTEMIKGDKHFDYRAKYLPGIVRKETPIRLPLDEVQAIRKACTSLFSLLGFEVYARIDGFYTDEGQVYLNDPNTTAGMNPSSFFFHQASEVGLNPTQLLTFLIRTSLSVRVRTSKAGLNSQQHLQQLDKALLDGASEKSSKLRVGVIMGGFSAERHISVESGRNICEKLASSKDYTPVPIFLSGTPENHQLFIVPMHVLLKDNADDIHTRLQQQTDDAYDSLMTSIRTETSTITKQYGVSEISQPVEVNYYQFSHIVDFAFIALHGRPGEDGVLQKLMERHGIPYNGSGVVSAALTIDKFKTNQLLRKNGIKVAEQRLVESRSWSQDIAMAIESIEAHIQYPMIAKPVDNGCSAAVLRIQNRAMLQAYADATFSQSSGLSHEQALLLKLPHDVEFPKSERFLVEELIVQGDAAKLIEITGGLVTHHRDDAHIAYELFAPSEVLAAGDILSLEEKFLAGEGQNITPARFHSDRATNELIVRQVQSTLEKVAKCLNLEGYARIDAFVKILPNATPETWIVEVNSLPAMTPATCIFHQCAQAGYSPLSFIHTIIQYGLKNHAKK